MIIQCPRCESTFSLADTMYQAGRKARCSQCKNIFVLPAVSETDAGVASAADSADGQGKKSSWRKLLLFIAFAIIFAGIGYGGYMLYTLLYAKTESADAVQAGGIIQGSNGQEEDLENILKNIQVENLRQVTVNNAKAGKLIVISGSLVNNTTSPKQMLSVQVRLLDKDDNVLASQQQVAGATLTQFQLEMLSEQELGLALGNTVDIVVNNTDVQPGDSVPFYVIFFRAPEFVFFDVTPVLAKPAEGLPQ